MQEQVYKIREVTKETWTDIAKLRMYMGATKKHEIKAIQNMTDMMDRLSKDVETSYDSFCTKVINTLKYFLGRN